MNNHIIRMVFVFYLRSRRISLLSTSLTYVYLFFVRTHTWCMIPKNPDECRCCGWCCCCCCFVRLKRRCFCFCASRSLTLSHSLSGWIFGVHEKCIQTRCAAGRDREQEEKKCYIVIADCVRRVCVIFLSVFILHLCVFFFCIFRCYCCSAFVHEHKVHVDFIGTYISFLFRF